MHDHGLLSVVVGRWPAQRRYSIRKSFVWATVYRHMNLRTYTAHTALPMPMFMFRSDKRWQIWTVALLAQQGFELRIPGKKTRLLEP